MEKELENAGLTGNEAKVYYELLKRGASTASTVSKNISMDRTLSYTVLNHLIEKGMVTYIIKENKKYFEASDPEHLLNSIKEKEIFVKDLIPKLKSIKKLKHNSHDVQIYEGKEGLRVMLNFALKEKELYSFGSTGKMFNALYEIPRLIEQINKSSVKIRIIGNEKYKGTDPFSNKNIDFRFLNIDCDATTSIFGDYVSIHSLNQKPFLILIKNKEIANGYRNYFEVLWKTASP